jgi:hypothetical protein
MRVGVGEGDLPAGPVGVALLHLHRGFLSDPDGFTALQVQGAGGVHRGVGGGAPSGEHTALLRPVQPPFPALGLAQQTHVHIRVEEIPCIDLREKRYGIGLDGVGLEGVGYEGRELDGAG